MIILQEERQGEGGIENKFLENKVLFFLSHTVLICCGTSRKQILLYPVPKKMPPGEAEHGVERQE